MVARWTLGGLVAATLIVPVVLASGSQQRPVKLRILFTANLRGVLEPCGCQVLQAGGLSRRATLLRALRQQSGPTLVVDAGDNLPPSRARPETLAFVFSALKHMRYDGVNVGPFDRAVPLQQIRASADEKGLPLVDGTCKAGSETAGPAVRIVKTGGLRVGIVGASPSDDAAQSVQATLRAIREARRTTRFVLVLSQMAPSEIERCAALAPPGTLFISGRHDATIKSRIAIGGSTLVACSFYGQGVGVVDVTLGADGSPRNVTAAQHALGPEIQRDLAVESLVKRFYQEHLALRPQSDALGETTRTLAGLVEKVGFERVACGSCHQPQHAFWKGTAHARAWQTLVSKSADNRADCIGCHTNTDLAVGSLGTTDSGVGCVTCHGGDPDHARHPDDPRFIVRRPATAVCTQCHTPQQSPRFTYASFLSRAGCPVSGSAPIRQ